MSRRRRGNGAPWAERETLDAEGAAEERILLGLRTVEGAEAAAFGTLGIADRVAGPGRRRLPGTATGGSSRRARALTGSGRPC
jgi:hypothetical protein